MSHHLTWWICRVGHECMGPKRNYRDRGHVGMFAWLDARVCYAMGYGKAIAWLYCRRTCNRTLIASNVDTCATTCTAILLFCTMIFQAYIMLMCIRGVCSSEKFMRICFDTAVTPNVVTAHPISHSCVSYMCLYVYVCVQPAVLGIDGMGKCVMQCFYRSIKFRMFCTYILSLL